jgi:hypothetical protein
LIVYRIAAGTDFANNDPLYLSYNTAGQTILPSNSNFYSPDTGSTADSDPGNGTFRFNNATQSSATVLYIDNNNYDSQDVTTWLDSFDDSTTSSNKGTLTLTRVSDPTIWIMYKVTGTIVNGTGYRKVPVTYLNSAGTLDTSKSIISFARTGDIPAAVETEVDFGAGAYAKEFAIADANAVTTNNIIASPSAKNPSVGYHDEIDMDPFTVQGRVNTNGTVIIKVVSCGDKLIGKRKINYILA